MKYVFIDRTYPIVFPDYLDHCSVKYEGKKVTSAGFCSFENGIAKAWGKSDSLKLGYEPGDEAFLQLMIDGVTPQNYLTLKVVDPETAKEVTTANIDHLAELLGSRCV